MDLHYEQRQLFRELKVRYKLGMRFLPLIPVLFTAAVIIAFNLLLALALDVAPNAPVKEQPIGQVWFVLFIIQIIVLIPAGVKLTWAPYVRFVGTALKWSEDKTEGICGGHAVSRRMESMKRLQANKATK